MVQDKTVLRYACPTCSAEPTQPCRQSETKYRSSVGMHYARWASAYEAIHGTKPTPEV